MFGLGAGFAVTGQVLPDSRFGREPVASHLDTPDFASPYEQSQMVRREAADCGSLTQGDEVLQVGWAGRAWVGALRDQRGVSGVWVHLHDYTRLRNLLSIARAGSGRPARHFPDGAIWCQSCTDLAWHRFLMRLTDRSGSTPARPAALAISLRYEPRKPCRRLRSGALHVEYGPHSGQRMAPVLSRTLASACRRIWCDGGLGRDPTSLICAPAEHTCVYSYLVSG